MTVLKSSGLRSLTLQFVQNYQEQNSEASESKQSSRYTHIQGKEQRTPEPGVNFTPFYDTSDFLKTSSRVGAVKIASLQASISFALALLPNSDGTDLSKERLPLDHGSNGETRICAFMALFCSCCFILTSNQQ